MEYERFEHLLPLDPPDCFTWVFAEFICLYNANDTVITPDSIEMYQRLHQFQFSLYEIELLFKMKGWAADEKMKLDRRDVDGKAKPTGT